MSIPTRKHIHNAKHEDEDDEDVQGASEMYDPSDTASFDAFKWLSLREQIDADVMLLVMEMLWWESRMMLSLSDF